MAVPVCIPKGCKKGSLFSTPSPAFIVCRLFVDGHSDQHEVISHCGFDLRFSNNEWCCASFHVFISIFSCVFCVSSLEECLSILWWGWLFFWCWAAWAACIFWRYYFLPFWRLSFHLMVSFIVRQLSSLIRSYLLTFGFVSVILRGGHGESCCDSCQCSAYVFL